MLPLLVPAVLILRVVAVPLLPLLPTMPTTFYDNDERRRMRGEEEEAEGEEVGNYRLAQALPPFSPRKRSSAVALELESKPYLHRPYICPRQGTLNLS